VNEAICLPKFIAFVFKEMLDVRCDFVVQVGRFGHAIAAVGAAFSDTQDSGSGARGNKRNAGAAQAPAKKWNGEGNDSD
jgi:hypothetical protein